MIKIDQVVNRRVGRFIGGWARSVPAAIKEMARIGRMRVTEGLGLAFCTRTKRRGVEKQRGEKGRGTRELT